MTDRGPLVHAGCLQGALAAVTAENQRLRAAMRVNALRWAPDLTHAEIDAEIERIAAGTDAVTGWQPDDAPWAGPGIVR